MVTRNLETVAHKFDGVDFKNGRDKLQFGKRYDEIFN